MIGGKLFFRLLMDIEAVDTAEDWWVILSVLEGCPVVDAAMIGESCLFEFSMDVSMVDATDDW